MKKIAHNHWARIGVLLMAVLLIGAVCFVGYAAGEMSDTPECYEHGDVNGDGVVDSRDALYLLDHPEEGEDYNGDGEVDEKDALYLLNNFFFKEDEDYQLDGQIHEFYAPDWSWDTENGTATAVFRCACGKEDETQTLEARVEMDDTNKATHTQPGSVIYTATVERDGKSYEDTYTVVLEATGHDADLAWTCDEDAHYHLCSCGEKLDVASHQWELDEEASTAATCEAGGEQVYSCVCGAQKKVATEPAGHSYNTYIGDKALDSCHFVKQYQCACGDVTEGTAEADSYTKHSYANAVAQQVDATCMIPGSKTYACDNCGEPHVVEIPVNANHSWELAEGSETDYVCAHGCGATKTVVVEVENIDTGSLSTDTELVVKPENSDTEISMSMNQEALEAVKEAGTISLKIDTLTSAQVEEQINTQLTKESIGDVIYDISMRDENGNLVFTDKGNGAITISVPYQLTENEDVDTIDVFYIDSEGNYQSVEGVYSNGFVTFTVEHFSYYTVTRLTTEERCSRYGHFVVDVSRAATCTEAGIAGKQICQRCGETISKGTEVAASGHSMQLDAQLSKDADCTHDGIEVYKCANENCYYATSKVTPAKGHTMDEGKVTEQATCTKVGKLVYTCTVGCGHTTTQTLPVLPHEYVLSQTVAPTCTAKGYESWKCTCSAEEKRNETPALGHSFVVKGWTWAEDLSSATLTLTCENNSTETRTLKAVVTATSAGESSCTQGGSVVYTAVAVYNGTTYNDTKEISSTASGHKSDSIWHYDGTQHYHLCTVCGAKTEDGEHTAGDKILYNGTQHYQQCTVCSGKMNAENHTMDDGEITEQPTCNTVGKKVYSCDHCDYQKSELIAPTGVHTYVDGVCTSCGQPDSEYCDHSLSKLEHAELEQYGICAGADIYVVSCECGENNRLELRMIGCDLEASEIETETAEDGSVRQVQIFSCAKCGLMIKAYIDVETDEENCVAQVSAHYSFIINGETVLQGQWAPEYESVRAHPETHEEQRVDLKELGLCGGELVITACPCGTRYTVNEMDSCQWAHMGYENDVVRYVCMNCGAEKTETYFSHPSQTEQCIEISNRQIVYSVKGVEVYRVTEVSPYFTHSYEPTNVRLYAENCEDGVFFTEVCTACGDTQERFIAYHGTLHSEYTDLSEYGLCVEGLIQWSCACDVQIMDHQFIYGENRCNWISYTDSSEICANCGLIRTTNMTATEKDENCESIETYTYTFQLKDGTVLAVVSDRGINQRHEMQTESTLLGDSCEDGVRITQSCRDCDYEHSYTTYYHHTYTVETIDLVALGACSGELQLESCACGESAHISYHDVSCNLVPHTGSENGYSELCTECGIIIGRTFTYVEGDIPCVTTCNTTLTVSREGNVLGTMSYQRLEENHDFLYTYTLVEGGTTCDDGYTFTGECIHCGQTRTSNGIYSGHENRMIGYQTIVDSGLCGKRVVEIYGCACGMEKHVEFDWEDGHCDFWHNGYLEEEGCEEFVCAVCGGKYRFYHDRQQASGSCYFLDTYRYVYFDAAGNQLGEYQYTHEGYDHTYIHSLTLVEGGKTCDDGYYLSFECIFCGEGHSNPDIHYGCNNWTLSAEVVGEGTLCSPVVLYTRGCACGNVLNYDMEWKGDSCHWYHSGYDKEGNSIYQCENCQSQRLEKLTSSQGDEPCQVVHSWEYVYMDSEGTELFRWQDTSYGYNHSYVFSYKLVGETCNEGYYMTRYCLDCGSSYSEEELYYGCEPRCVSRETLLQTPCGTVDWVTSSCACGARVESSISGDCDWYHVGYDDKLQMGRYECGKCGTVRYTSTSVERFPEECRSHQILHYIFQDAEGNELKDVTLERDVSSHTRAFQFHLLGDSCEDGYTYTESCKYCGQLMGQCTEVQTGHSAYEVEEIDLSVPGSCGGYIHHYACPCGKYNYYEDNIWCSWDHKGSDEDGTDHYQCSTCGVEFYLRNNGERDPETCTMSGEYRFGLISSGVTVVEIRDRFSRPSHEYNAVHMELMDPEKGCDGGYIVTMQCACGDSLINEGYGHNTYITNRISTECGTQVYVYSCACGERQSVDLNNWCEMTGSSSAETDENGHSWQCDTETCKTCGLQIIDKYRDEFTEDACYGTAYHNRIVYLNGELISKSEWVYEASRHDDEESFELMEGATSCTDGLRVTYTCKRCGEVSYSTRYYHNYNVVQYVDLAEHGACGGYFKYLKCPCGEEESIDWETECEHMTHRYVNQTDEDGKYWSGSRYTCTDCGLIVTDMNYSYIPEGSCYGTWEGFTTITMGDEQIAYGEESGGSESHDNETFCYLLEGSTTCEDGVHVIQTCRRCARVNEYETYWHQPYQVQRVELAEHGACGGYFEIFRCACGAESYSNNSWDCDFGMGESWTETDAEGILWSCEQSACEGCGLVVTHKRAQVYPEGSCYGTSYHKTILTMNGSQIVQFEDVGSCESHKDTVTYQLSEGSTSCEDGVDVTYTCAACGRVETSTQQYHERYPVDHFDLAAHGSVCGGELVLYICACGEYNHVEYSDETKCDFGDYSIDHWIEGVVSDEQCTTEGWTYTNSYSYEHICAVTDPQCGFKLRSSRYYLVENCWATQYICWQYYDTEAGTWVDIFHEPTGEAHAYHEYEETITDLEGDTGYYETKEVCKHCQSSNTHRNYYENGVHVANEVERINTLNNGERQRWYQISRYAKLVPDIDNSYTTLNRTEYTYADGGVYWWQDEWTYNFENGCSATRTYTNSEGEQETYEENGHYITRTDTYEDPTCSQFGLHTWVYHCAVCGEVTDVEEREIEPNDHDFYWDEELQTWKCWECGMENINGASGSIVMQDMSSSEDYIVGYWNRGGVDFSVHVMLVRYDENGAITDEVELNVDVSHSVRENHVGFTAVIVNRAEAHAQAEALMSQEAYAGDYAIRITFVPASDAYDLDYAVTFDAQSYNYDSAE